jgi:hypothetical protein
VDRSKEFGPNNSCPNNSCPHYKKFPPYVVDVLDNTSLSPGGECHDALIITIVVLFAVNKCAAKHLDIVPPYISVFPQGFCWSR